MRYEGGDFVGVVETFVLAVGFDGGEEAVFEFDVDGGVGDESFGGCEEVGEEALEGFRGGCGGEDDGDYQGLCHRELHHG